MREFLSVAWLMIISIASLILTSAGAIFNAAGQMLHVYFTRCGMRHDVKYAAKLQEQADKALAAKPSKELN